MLATVNPLALAREARVSGDAKRGAALFYNQTLSCAVCHDPPNKNRLGPDLASKRDGVTDLFLVESVLKPSKVIRKGYENFMVEKKDGLVLAGFRVSEDANTFVIRELAAGKHLKLAKNDLVSMKQIKVSLMPSGLVNQLKDRGQFLDLVRFLLEVNEGGPARMAELKRTATGK